MIKPGFLSPAERRELEACIRRQSEQLGIGRRAMAILLLDGGRPCRDIAEFLLLDDDTVRIWHRAYREGGREALSSNDWKGRQSRTAPAEEEQLRDWLDGRFCRSTAPAVAWIPEEFRLEYSRPGCAEPLRRLGYGCRKPKPLPRVPPAEKQAESVEKYNRLVAGLGEDEAACFADAAHPEHQTRPAFGWAEAGSNPAVTTAPGRGRADIHGATDLENFDAPFVEPATADGESAARLLAKIEARNPEKRLIHVIWDNAAYHKGREAGEFLARPDCRIRSVQLPPYCPHSDPIERLWGVMHQFVTHNRHYPTQKQFAGAILGFFRETIPKDWKSFRDRVSVDSGVAAHEEYRVL